MTNKLAILVKNAKGETIKWFPVWSYDEGKSAKVIIKLKNKEGEKKKLVKTYEGWGEKAAINCCVEAVIKYWQKYNIQKHDMVISGGHNHEVTKNKAK